MDLLGEGDDYPEVGEARGAVPAGVFLEFEAGVGAELIGSVPKALFQRVRGLVLLRWRDPNHEFPVSLARLTSQARKPPQSPGWRQVSVVIAMPRTM